MLIVDIDKKGTVLKKPDPSGMVEVQAGIIKTRVKLSNLRLLENQTVTVKPAQPYCGKGDKPMGDGAKTEIDVRGMTVDEAEVEVDKAIDIAVMRKLNELRVIHGKGTGALRAGLHKHFKNHPSVRSFRLGVYGEGETGVTILELK